ncbi:MAG: hypothetical protein MJE63_01710 [Proteobacteria bacterium]|nr:hypothetical protein [Pseudomonadota bacterium]
MTSANETRKRHLFAVLRVLKWTLLGVIMAVIFALIFGVLVKWLWSVTLAPLFGTATPGYWQAVGIVVLARLVFGGFHRNGHKSRYSYSGHYKNEKREAWLRKMHDRFHEESPISEDDDTLQIPDDLKKHYREFWQKEGKEAFKNYLAKRQSNEENRQEYF